MRSHARLGRRDFLRSATTSLFTTAACGQAFADDAPNLRSSGRATRCVLVYLLGGPPHQDMWDLKLDAPAEIRGPFQPIQTATPGVVVSEHLPRLAAQTERLAILRSLGYPNADHPFMTYYTLTGRISARPLGANSVLPPSRDDDPHMGCVVSRFRHPHPEVPGYVAIPEVQVRMTMTPVAGGGRAGFLGPEYNPLAVQEDPRRHRPASLQIPAEITAPRRAGREQLLAQLDGQASRHAVTSDYQAVRRRALELTAGGEDLFELAQEPPRLRASYGDHRFGQSLLLARRLVERGVSFVGVHFNHMSRCDGWDTHQDNFNALKNELLPMLDEGLSALLADLADRGLLDETLVVCMGEFGRTPKINAQAGRDHWGHCGTAVLAGGGVRGGQVIGATDRLGAYPTETPVGPPDLVASIYHALGLNPAALIVDPRLNRTLQLSDGRVIRRLFAG